MSYWLMKSEPSTYSIDHLQKDGKTAWEGVRNYQARNFMTKEMSIGDQVFFYHSNADITGIAGLAKVCSKPHADLTAFQPKSDFYDPKATKENPIWECVDIQFVKKFPNVIPLEILRKTKGLENMKLLQKGSRLSITPVTEKEFEIILSFTKK